VEDMAERELEAERKVRDDRDRYKAALEWILRYAAERRSNAALKIDGPGSAVPSQTPYADTLMEAFCYWRGYREGIGFINAVAHDVLVGKALMELPYIGTDNPRRPAADGVIK